jgi:hypothetical protein
MHARFFGMLLLGLSFLNNSYAQYFEDDYLTTDIVMEAGAGIGMMNCLTDLGGNEGIGKKYFKDMNLGQSQVSSGFYFGAMYRKMVGLRLEATFGRVKGTDDVLSDVLSTDIAKTRYNRGLNFRSKITEFSLLAEVHPLFIFFNWENSDMPPPSISPYLLGGVGYFSFNPQAELDGKIIDLQPLRTEGQGFKEYPDRQPYKLRQFNLPFGAGIKYNISPIINIKGEVVYRKLNTDYLDDVSSNYIDPSLYELNGFAGNKLLNAIRLNNRVRNGQEIYTGPGAKRGSPIENDSYFSFNLKVGIYLKQRMF